MPEVRPLNGYFVNPQRVAEVVAPAYDALSPCERHRFAVEHPANFLNAIRSPEEFPPSQRPTRDEVLEGNAEHLRRMIREELFLPSPAPCMYVYQLVTGGHTQTGLVAGMPIREYREARLKPHEQTRASKEDDLLAYQLIVGASSSPVCVAYPHRERVDALIAGVIAAGPPLVDFESDHGLVQRVWRIEDEQVLAELSRELADVPATYITDGHHRSASLARYVADHDDDHGLLTVLFPDSELRILSYNRCVRDLNGQEPAALLAGLDTDFDVCPLVGEVPPAAQPRRRGEFGMLLDGRWYRLTLHDRGRLEGHPVRSLDVSILQERVLGPLLEVDPQSERLDFVAGTEGLEGLIARWRAGWRVGFACHPTSIDELMAVADAGLTMPPKSTWFDPKARSGLFLLIRQKVTANW